MTIRFLKLSVLLFSLVLITTAIAEEKKTTESAKDPEVDKPASDAEVDKPAKDDEGDKPAKDTEGEKPAKDAEGEKKKDFTIPKLEIEMIFVKEGTFMMGQPGAGKEWTERKDRKDMKEGEKFTYMNHYYHSVTLTKPYWIGKYEVTQKEWKAVVGNDPSHFKGERRPVECINWYEAKEYCKKLTTIEKEAGRLPEGYAYRLPTEAEWEHAAKGGVKNKENFEYSGSNTASEVAWYSNRKDPRESHDVGKKKPNQLGIYDMSGNVWEWTLDFGMNTGKASSNVKYLITDTYVDGIVDPLSTKGKMPVRRGGSWMYGDYNSNLAVYNRRMLHHAHRGINRVGFRIVLAVDRENVQKRNNNNKKRNK